MCFHITIRVGRSRYLATDIPDEWSSLRKKYRTRLIDLSIYYVKPSGKPGGFSRMVPWKGLSTIRFLWLTP